MLVPVRSLTDVTVGVSRGTNVEEINVAFAAASGPLAAVLDYSEEPLVSADIVGSPASCIFDAGLTKVVNGHLAKVASSYINEYGFSTG